MHQIKPLLTVLFLLLLMGCGGGGSVPGAQQLDQPLPVNNQPADSDQARLVLDAEALGNGEWSLMLRASQASDLYQIAGTLQFDPNAYELLSVEAGGGLGDPSEAYFVNSGGRNGELDFAYTSRYYGRINSGDLNLLRLKLRPTTEFSLADFSLPLETDSLLIRNSGKQLLEPSLSRGGA